MHEWLTQAVAVADELAALLMRELWQAYLPVSDFAVFPDYSGSCQASFEQQVRVHFEAAKITK